MSWYPDLSRHTMVAEGDHVRAVGWLSHQETFPTGKVPLDFIARLREFYQLSSDSFDALSFRLFAGVHTCEFCEKVHESRDFGVATETVLFIAPGMIVHYVESHAYQPPDEFISAVLTAPLPNTDEYAMLATPFCRLHEAARDRERQQHLEAAGQWALQLGGTDAAVREVASQMFGNDADEVCAWIRNAIQKL